MVKNKEAAAAEMTPALEDAAERAGALDGEQQPAEAPAFEKPTGKKVKVNAMGTNHVCIDGCDYHAKDGIYQMPESHASKMIGYPRA